MGKEALKDLVVIVNEVLKTKEVPSDRTKGIILPFHKKGDKRNWKNYRGIT